MPEDVLKRGRPGLDDDPKKKARLRVQVSITGDQDSWLKAQGGSKSRAIRRGLLALDALQATPAPLPDDDELDFSVKLTVSLDARSTALVKRWEEAGVSRAATLRRALELARLTA